MKKRDEKKLAGFYLMLYVLLAIAYALFLGYKSIPVIPIIFQAILLIQLYARYKSGEDLSSNTYSLLSVLALSSMTIFSIALLILHGVKQDFSTLLFAKGIVMYVLLVVTNIGFMVTFTKPKHNEEESVPEEEVK